jgi:hypothetical protein
MDKKRPRVVQPRKRYSVRLIGNDTKWWVVEGAKQERLNQQHLINSDSKSAWRNFPE